MLDRNKRLQKFFCLDNKTSLSFTFLIMNVYSVYNCMHSVLGMKWMRNKEKESKEELKVEKSNRWNRKSGEERTVSWIKSRWPVSSNSKLFIESCQVTRGHLDVEIQSSNWTRKFTSFHFWCAAGREELIHNKTQFTQRCRSLNA
jgi:hypothetical protein